MPSPSDREFFESMNRDLASGLGKAIKDNFTAEIKISRGSIEQLGKAINKAVGGKPASAQGGAEADSGGGGKGGAGEASMLKKLGGFAKSIVSAGLKVTSANASHIRQFGDSLAKTAVATGNASILASENISHSFGQWHQDLAQVGQNMRTSLEMNVKHTDKTTQKLIARSVGLGTSMGALGKFMTTTTNVMGMNTSEMLGLGTEIQNLALSNNLLADSVFEAATSFQAATKGTQLLAGQSTAEMMKMVAGLEAATTGVGIGELVQRIVSFDPQKQAQMNALLARAGIQGDTSQINNDPTGFIAKAIAAISKVSGEAKGMGVQSGAYLQGISRAFGLNESMMFAAQAATRDIGGVASLRQVSAPVAVQSDQSLQQQIQGSSEAAFFAMKDFAIEINGLSIHQAFLSTASQAAEEALYDAGEAATAFAKALGGVAGGQAAFQTADAGLGGAGGGLLTMLGIGALTQSKRFAGLFGRNASIPKTIAPKTGSWVKNPNTGRNIKVGGPTFNAMTAAEQAAIVGDNTVKASRGALAKSAMKTTLKTGAKATPLNLVLAGGLDLLEHGDKSHAAAAAVGSAGGFWGGAAAGAGLGALTGPAAPVLAPLFGLIGGIMGSIGGEKLATTVHDEFDPEFVAKREEEARIQAAELATQELDGVTRLVEEAEDQTGELKASNTALESMTDILSLGFAELEKAIKGINTGSTPGANKVTPSSGGR